MPNIPFPREIPLSVQDMRTEFEKLMERLWHGGWIGAPLDGQDWAPPIDVIDDKDQYRIRIEMPGLSADDVNVFILANVLTVKGTKASERRAGEEPAYLRSECRFGSFCRKYEFPSPVQEDAIRATCKNGVLMVEVPKTAAAIGKPVRVEFQD